MKGFNLDNVDTTISSDGQINGTKSTVLNAGNADHFLVFGKSGDGYAFGLVNKSSDGVKVVNYKTYDGFVSGDLVLENCKCDAVFSAENAHEILEETILDAIVCVSSEAVGAMEKSYKLTIEYTQQREQFGQSLSKFQALQHRMVDMFMETEFTKSFLLKCLQQKTLMRKESLSLVLKIKLVKQVKLLVKKLCKCMAVWDVQRRCPLVTILRD